MSKKQKIYTKTGDKGETSLLGGKRVPKNHIRIEAYGALDELSAFIGLIRDQDIDKYSREVLIGIQEKIFTAGTILAKDPDFKPSYPLPQISQEDITHLENEIDNINEKLPSLKNFILPGGHPVVSYCHIARTICRRAERNVIGLAQAQQIDNYVLKYLNLLVLFH